MYLEGYFALQGFPMRHVGAVATVFFASKEALGKPIAYYQNRAMDTKKLLRMFNDSRKYERRMRASVFRIC